MLKYIRRVEDLENCPHAMDVIRSIIQSGVAGNRFPVLVEFGNSIEEDVTVSHPKIPVTNPTDKVTWLRITRLPLTMKDGKQGMSLLKAIGFPVSYRGTRAGVSAAADALQHLHDNGLIHLSLKDSNKSTTAYSITQRDGITDVCLLTFIK